MAADQDTALRPTSFDTYIGQAQNINTMRTAVRAAQRGKWQLDHCLITGPAGLGKTSLVQVIAAEIGTKLHVTSAPAITHKGELVALLTSLDAGDMLFIDEIHRLSVTLQEVLYTAMEDGVLDMAAGKKVIRVPLPKFTLLGATTHQGSLSGPLLARFGFVLQLSFYSVADLTTIVLRSAGLLGVAIDEEGATEIARRSRGTPRLANRLLHRVRDFVMGTDAPGGLLARTTIGSALAAVALASLSVDAAGLDQLDRKYLAALCARKGVPAGVDAMASVLCEQRTTLEDVVEPYLCSLGFVLRTPRGRVATERGAQHLAALASS